MASKTSIINLALSRLGQDQITNAETDDSPNARFGNAFYDQTRDEILESNPWTFAMADADLTQLVESPNNQWTYQYALPDDCIRVMACNDTYYGIKGFFVIQGRLLLTNQNSARIRYVQRIEDESIYPPLFVEAFSCKLAARIAKPLTGSDQMAQAFSAEYLQITGPTARRMDAYERYTHPVPIYRNSDLVRSRSGFFGGTTYGGSFPYY